MLSKFLDPKNRVTFQRIFGTKRNKDVLIDFLNEMITFKEICTFSSNLFLLAS
jgi:hypothetical protein